MTDDIFKEVRFDLYCSQCKEEKTKETDDPCNECLAEPINQHSNKPIHFKKKKENNLWLRRF